MPAGGVTNFNVVEVAPGSGPLTNSAGEVSATGDPNLVNNTNVVAVTAVGPEADVAIGKSGAGVVFAGSNLVDTITVTNFGPSAAGGVVVTDALPGGGGFCGCERRRDDERWRGELGGGEPGIGAGEQFDIDGERACGGSDDERGEREFADA